MGSGAPAAPVRRAGVATQAAGRPHPHARVPPGLRGPQRAARPRRCVSRPAAVPRASRRAREGAAPRARGHLRRRGLAGGARRLLPVGERVRLAVGARGLRGAAPRGHEVRPAGGRLRRRGRRRDRRRPGRPVERPRPRARRRGRPARCRAPRPSRAARRRRPAAAGGVRPRPRGAADPRGARAVRLETAHQFAPTIAYGDAVGNDCFELQRLYWSRGVRSDLFAAEAKPEVRQLVQPWRDVEQLPVEGTSLQVHISMGNDALWDVAKLPHPQSVIYHNITPAHFFTGLNEHARRYSEIGREQLAAFAKVSELGIADSDYNAKELLRLGFAKTAVVPIIVDWSAFDVVPDPAVLRELSDERTDIIAVGQILPQKAAHKVGAAFAKYRESDKTAPLWLVGSPPMSQAYPAPVPAPLPPHRPHR